MHGPVPYQSTLTTHSGTHRPCADTEAQCAQNSYIALKGRQDMYTLQPGAGPGQGLGRRGVCIKMLCTHGQHTSTHLACACATLHAGNYPRLAKRVGLSEANLTSLLSQALTAELYEATYENAVIAYLGAYLDAELGFLLYLTRYCVVVVVVVVVTVLL